MIRPLRMIHKRIIVLLAMVLPTLYAAALLSRKAAPIMDLTPAGLFPTDQRGKPIASVSSKKGDVIVTLYGSPATQDAPYHLGILVDAALNYPDLLAYWTPSMPGDKLPDDAVMLGKLIPGREVIHHDPGHRTGTGGAIIGYSLARQEIIFALPVKTPPEAHRP